MKSKIIAALVATVIFVVILFALGFVKQKDESVKQKEEKVKVIKVGERGHCNSAENRVCRSGFSCEDGVCFPKIDYKEIVDPKEDKPLYDIAKAGPFKYDYILHVDRLVVSEKLYVWLGETKKPIWFKARREKELRPYEIKVPKGKRILIKLGKSDKSKPAEFRGKIYLTKP